MNTCWVEKEIEDVNLEDERLNRRLGIVLSALGNRPTSSIPEACGGYAEMKAAYRFFSNEKATFTFLLEPHVESTKSRISNYSVVLLVQDTTEIDLTKPNQQMKGVGFLDHSRRGILLHNQQAFTPDGTPLGSVGAEILRKEKKRSIKKERGNYKNKPIEKKESYRWLSGLQTAKEISEELPNTHFISVTDSESDIYEFFSELSGDKGDVDIILRSCQNRRLISNENTESLLYEEISNSPIQFNTEIAIRARKQTKISCEDRRRRKPRTSRKSLFAVRVATVTLKPPYRSDRKLTPVIVNAVSVCELKPPKGEEPIEWILLTTLPVNKKKNVELIIKYYSVRWMIEILFKTLKSGCCVEERQFEHIDHFESCLALYLIIAWRALYVCRIARSSPGMSCEKIFDPSEWKAVYMVINKKPPPKKIPNIMQTLEMVAQLGGYIKRNGNPPGPKSTWVGLQRAHDFALAWTTFGPGANK